MRFGVNGGGARGDWLALLDWAQTVEDLGFDSFWINDHTGTSWRDCWTALTAVAIKTRRVRLGSLVSCVYYRPPSLLARMAADVDRLSNGRLVLGLGVGDLPSEFAQLGLPFPSLPMRQAALGETVEILRGLWSGDPFTFDGAHFRVGAAAVRPGPVQAPRVPILIAGGGERVTMRQVAQYADASNFGPSGAMGSAWESGDVAQKYAVLRQHCEQIGRPYDSVLRTFYPNLLLAKTESEVQAKVDARAARSPLMERPRLPGMPREFRATYVLSTPDQIPLHIVAGTPEQVTEYLRLLVEAGVQYVSVSGNDAETVQLLSEQVMPQFQGAAFA
ncbi:MAG TPA: LLM class flavin-dependent oxidoreductase [Ktedonobacterales bacterium]|nr:LLM class flavin-dependent oxidoreductase [Ktedonobacterales bacterium]